MKKTIMCATILLLVVGCGKKKLTENVCTKTISDEKSSVTYTETIQSDKETVKNILSKKEQTFDENSETFAQFKTYAEAIKDEYNKSEGVSATLEFKDTTIILDIEYDIENMTTESFERNNLNFKSRQELIDNYKNDGYTCK